jgi:hypothetical protein
MPHHFSTSSHRRLPEQPLTIEYRNASISASVSMNYERLFVEAFGKAVRPSMYRTPLSLSGYGT